MTVSCSLARSVLVSLNMTAIFGTDSRSCITYRPWMGIVFGPDSRSRARFVSHLRGRIRFDSRMPRSLTSVVARKFRRSRLVDCSMRFVGRLMVERKSNENSGSFGGGHFSTPMSPIPLNYVAATKGKRICW